MYNKHSGELISFVDICDVQKHLTALEQSCLIETSDSNPKLATHKLVFMIFSSLEFLYAQFSVASASRQVIFPICIEHLEIWYLCRWR